MDVVIRKGSSDGGMNEEKKKLPIGFRFRPTDEEVVVHYLKRRAMSLPLPASIIPDLHVFNFDDPWSLPGDLKEKRYYFWKRKGILLGNKFSKVMPTSSGFWKVNGKVKQILSSGPINDVVGTKKTWTFYKSKSPSHEHRSKTRWFMHEFQLVDSTQNGKYEAGDWVVCRVFQRKRKHKNLLKVAPKCNMGNDSPSSFDFKVENNIDLGPPQPSSPFSTTD